MSVRGRFGPLVGAIDEGTSSARFLVFAAKTSELLTYHQIDIRQITPREGWVEQDPIEILNSTKECIDRTIENLKNLDISPEDIVTIGITNQRETTLVWDCETGKPLYNALVWLDIRTSETVDRLLSDVRGRNVDCLRDLCGLPISTYFSATKIRWLIDNVAEVQEAIKKNTCLFGTVDSWLLWNLTGGKYGGLHITDVTNASRTMLMNIKKLQWDPYLCRFFGIPMSILPVIRSSSEIYGYLCDTLLQGLPISGCLGDQQSALVGQMCLKPGQAKNTYGTGCFLLCNTGTNLVMSSHGLLSTIAYKLGENAPVIYALEGSIAVAGAAVRWLRDNLKMIDNTTETKEIAETVDSVGEVVFVPAFSGLYAPYWRQDARSVICGLTEKTTKAHIVRATLEAVCFQTRDILESMNKDCSVPFTKLLVDGGMSINDFVMQQQADLTGVPVIRPVMTETTALGAAMAAGSAKGIDVWNLSKLQAPPNDTFIPSITDDERDYRYSKWKMAIHRSLGWDIQSELSRANQSTNKLEAIKKSIPAIFYLFSSFFILFTARHFT